jgi:ribulose-phosphate 3-epimerase
MSVNPGFGGQKFIGNVLNKAKNLFTYLQKNNLTHVQLEIDGGVKLDNVQEIVSSGINILVSGSGLFSGDLSKNISEMKQKIATM